MAVVTLSIADRHYKLSCAPGQEEVLARLGQTLDEKAGQLLKSIGFIQENQLLLMLAVLALQEGQSGEKKRLALEEEITRLQQAEQQSCDAFKQAYERAESEKQELQRELEHLKESLEAENALRLKQEEERKKQASLYQLNEDNCLKTIENLTKRITALAEMLKKE